MRYLKDKTLGVIGLGNMGCAILNGLISSDALKKNAIFGFDVDAKKCRFAKRRFGISILKSEREVAVRSDIILLAVKPQNMEAVLRDISVGSGKNKLYISIAAGITTHNIEMNLGGKPHIIRIMPNMPALIGEGISVVCKGRYAMNSDMALAGEIISSVGDIIRLDEKYFDLVTAVSGSGPAYFLYLIEAMIDAAAKMGLDRKVAARLVSKTALGTVKLLIDSKNDPKTLRMRVTSKGGTTAEAIGVFDRSETKQIIAKAVLAAARRSKELSGG